jgi:hypothetical protein
MKSVYSESDWTTKPHYAVLTFDSIYIPGDERSRTHPGHGYPESTESVVRYTVFETLEEVTAWVLKEKASETNRWSPKPFKVIKVNPVEIITTHALKVVN